jgi:hypothetical protein
MFGFSEVASFVYSLSLSLGFFLSLLIYLLFFQDILMFLSSSATTYSNAKDLFVFFFFNLCVGALGTAATIGLLYHPRMTGEGDCGEIGGMKFGKGNRSTRRKPAPAPLCPPQIPHD